MSTQDRIAQMVKENRVFLFMKGTKHIYSGVNIIVYANPVHFLYLYNKYQQKKLKIEHT